jgi:indolepyruvate ferredoxin oxidoreductase beta subunit
VLSIAAVIAQAALGEGLALRQSEVHGMAQRGGAVLAHLRIADAPIPGDLVPRGGADLIISMEPLESLRYVEWLSPTGALVTAAEPFVNIPNYPEMDSILAALHGFPLAKVVAAAALAKEAGLARAVNTVMVGAASPFLSIKPESLEAAVEAAFAGKGAALAEANKRAFRLGREAAA